MRKLAFAIAALAAITMTGLSAQAADPIASHKLASFGLAKLAPISDAEGSAVRGRGVFVSGFSVVRTGGVTYYGQPYAKSGAHFAAGVTFVSAGGAAAGGFSAAVAH